MTHRYRFTTLSDRLILTVIVRSFPLMTPGALPGEVQSAKGCLPESRPRSAIPLVVSGRPARVLVFDTEVARLAA